MCVCVCVFHGDHDIASSKKKPKIHHIVNTVKEDNTKYCVTCIYYNASVMERSIQKLLTDYLICKLCKPHYPKFWYFLPHDFPFLHR